MENDITVIVPYHNESNVIEVTLTQIANQTVPAKSAIFVNSSSTDDSSDVVDDWIKDNQPKFLTKFHNIFENTSNPGSSKNVGIRNANSEWIAFMDCGHRFDQDWLEKQANYVAKNGLYISFGTVCLTGTNWVDRCAVAQTYGYKRKRPCVPSSLMKKSIFDETGLFIEGKRAGYDLAWRLKVEDKISKCGVNYDVSISSLDINFSPSILNILKKSILYARSSFGLDGYFVPYYYLLLLSLLIFIVILLPSLFIPLLLVYFFLRTFIIPVVKSQGGAIYKEYPLAALFGLGLIGLAIDLGKIAGYLLGVFDLFKNKLYGFKGE